MIPSSRRNAERTIALARVALGVTSLFAIWLDPAEPARFAGLTYLLQIVYVVYALVIAALVWLRQTGATLALVSHLADIAAFSVLQFLTLGPSSPFFVYFIFSLFCAAIRWGWGATLWTAALVVVAYLAMTSLALRVGAQEFEVNRAIIRTMYLIVSAGLLVYLGRHEQRLRTEIQRLAHWPAASGADVQRVVDRLLEHAAEIMAARRAVLIWEAGEEPHVNVALWPPGGKALQRRSPDAVEHLLPPSLEHATFVGAAAITAGTPLTVSTADMPAVRHSWPLPPLLAPLLGAVGLSSAQFRTDRVSGRVFFAGLGTPGAEIVPLTDIVAREIGTSLEQLHVTLQLQDIAASEERIRVSRDLHDGVLQSLTGIRLEIRSLATSIASNPEPGRARLIALERALAIEQRELRLFIESLGPARRRGEPAHAGNLRERLEVLKERMALEWKTPVTLRVTTGISALREPLADAIPLMVHEAVVNAVKHGDPSRVAVAVERSGSHIRIVVTDDGQGFPFTGRYDHAALESLPGAPRSLLERVSAMGGELSIDSGASGSRVEMTIEAGEPQTAAEP
jgi:signal transduction histidine kinase